MIKVDLTINEFAQATVHARDRIFISAAMQLNHSTTYSRTLMKRFEEELTGACAELAVGKLSGRWFVPSINSFHRTPDCLADVEVRGTVRPDGRLIVRDNDPDDRKYVLCIVTGENVTVAGWMLGKDAKEDRWVANPHGHRDAWFVPQSELQAAELIFPE